VDVDHILQTLASQKVDYILIGGMNFLLNHRPELTFDVDLWIEDSESNLARINSALRELGAEWGRTETQWRPVSTDSRWLKQQSVFCVTSPFGAVDIFREVRGLEGQYAECKGRALQRTTGTGVAYTSLSDRDMLACQLALPEAERKPGRVETLLRAIGGKHQPP
jgi:hypothetical protein